MWIWLLLSVPTGIWLTKSWGRFILATFLIVVCGTFFCAYNAEAAWLEYAPAHHCQYAGAEEQGFHFVYTIQPDGTPSVLPDIIPGGYTYACDGGETVSR